MRGPARWGAPDLRCVLARSSAGAVSLCTGRIRSDALCKPGTYRGGDGSARSGPLTGGIVSEEKPCLRLEHAACPGLMDIMVPLQVFGSVGEMSDAQISCCAHSVLNAISQSGRLLCLVVVVVVKKGGKAREESYGHHRHFRSTVVRNVDDGLDTILTTTLHTVFPDQNCVRYGRCRNSELLSRPARQNHVQGAQTTKISLYVTDLLSSRASLELCSRKVAIGQLVDSRVEAGL